MATGSVSDEPSNDRPSWISSTRTLMNEAVSTYFYKHGLFCAHHPAPIIFWTGIVTILAGLPLLTVFMSASHQPRLFTAIPCFPGNLTTTASLSSSEQPALESSGRLFSYRAFEHVPGASRFFSSSGREPTWLSQKEPLVAVQQVVIPMAVGWRPSLNDLGQTLLTSSGDSTTSSRTMADTVTKATSVVNELLAAADTEDSSSRASCMRANDGGEDASATLRHLLPTSGCVVIDPTLLSRVDVVQEAAGQQLLWKRIVNSLMMTLEVELSVVESLVHSGPISSTETDRSYLIITSFVTGSRHQLQNFTQGVRSSLEKVGLSPRPAEDTLTCVHSFYANGVFRYSLDMLSMSLSYIMLFLYITFTAAKIHLVKSKWGLAFTAVINVLLSVVISVGLCMRFGLSPSLNAWEVLPFMITIIGFENTMVLIKSVTSTPLELPVNHRIALGLSKEGVNISYMLAKHFCLIASVYLLMPAEIQEFCLFALLAIMVDFFLQIVFFATVLSIDIRRLELADLASIRERSPTSGVMLSRSNSSDSSSRPADSRMSSMSSSTGCSTTSSGAQSPAVTASQSVTSVTTTTPPMLVDQLPRQPVPRRLQLAEIIFGSRVLQHMLLIGTVLYFIVFIVLFENTVLPKHLATTNQTLVSPSNQPAPDNNILLADRIAMSTPPVGGLGAPISASPPPHTMLERNPSLAAQGATAGGTVKHSPSGAFHRHGNGNALKADVSERPDTPSDSVHAGGGASIRQPNISSGDAATLMFLRHQSQYLAHKTWPILLNHYGVPFTSRFLTYLPPVVLSSPHSAHTPDITAPQPDTVKQVNAQQKPHIEAAVPEANAADDVRTHPHDRPHGAAAPAIKPSLPDRFFLILRDPTFLSLFLVLAILIPCNMICHSQCVRSYMRRQERATKLGRRFERMPAVDHLAVAPVVLPGCHGNLIECVASDGPRVASVTLSGEIQLWDIVTAKLLTEKQDREQAPVSSSSPPLAAVSSACGSGSISGMDTPSTSLAAASSEITNNVATSNSSGADSAANEALTPLASTAPSGATTPTGSATGNSTGEVVSPRRHSPVTSSLSLGSLPHSTSATTTSKSQGTSPTPTSTSGYDFSRFVGTLDQYSSPFTTPSRHPTFNKYTSTPLGTTRSCDVIDHSQSDSGVQDISTAVSGSEASTAPLGHSLVEAASASPPPSPVWCMALQSSTVVLGRGNGAVEMYDGCSSRMLTSYTTCSDPVTAICYSSPLHRVVVMRNTGCIDVLAVTVRRPFAGDSFDEDDDDMFSLPPTTASAISLPVKNRIVSASVTSAPPSIPADFPPPPPLVPMAQSKGSLSSSRSWHGPFPLLPCGTPPLSSQSHRRQPSLGSTKYTAARVGEGNPPPPLRHSNTISYLSMDSREPAPHSGSVISIDDTVYSTVWGIGGTEHGSRESVASSSTASNRSVEPEYRLLLLSSSKAHRQAASCLLMHDNLAITASHDQQIKLFNMENGVCIRSLCGLTSGVTCLSLDKKPYRGDDKHTFSIIAGCLNGSVCTWMLPASTDCQHKLENAHSCAVQSATSRGNVAVSAGLDGFLCLWHLDKEVMIHRIAQTTLFCRDISLLSASLLAVPTSDSLLLVDVYSGKQVDCIPLGHRHDDDGDDDSSSSAGMFGRLGNGDPATTAAPAPALIRHLVQTLDTWLVTAVGSHLTVLHFPTSQHKKE